MADEARDINTVTIAADIAGAYLSNPHTRASADDVKALLAAIHGIVRELGSKVGDAKAGGVAPTDAPDEVYTPKVSVRKSLADPDFIVSMIDGRPYRTLKRHLAGHGLTPDAYRARYGLKADYPLTAPNYSAARSEMAKARNFGGKAGQSQKKQPQNAPERPSTASKAKSGRIDAAEAKKRAQSHLRDA